MEMHNKNSLLQQFTELTVVMQSTVIRIVSEVNQELWLFAVVFKLCFAA